QSTRLTAWQNWVGREYGVCSEDYGQLQRWSVEQREQFWDSIARYFAVKFHTPATAVIEQDAMPGTRWFPGATLNFAEHLLRHRSDKPAIIRYLENGDRRETSFNQLRADTGALAHWLQQQGIKAGDRVVGIMPN